MIIAPKISQHEKLEPRYKMLYEFCILKGTILSIVLTNVITTIPHVVLMDATYKTNKYNLPFLEIVGVTSTSKTFSIAFWPLTCLKLTINNSFCPRVNVTDRDLALMEVCEDVFPQSNHLLCRCHIFKDIKNICWPCIKSQKTGDSLHLKWKKLVESPTPSAYMQAYADLQALLSKKSKYIWLSLQCLVGKPKFKDSIFKSLRHHVSKHTLDNILEELHHSKGFVQTPENCGCQLKTYFEIPCAHEHRALDFKPCGYVDYSNLNVDHHMERFYEKFNNQPNHVKYNYIRKMEETPDPSKIMIN
uniref:MULE transposase domain-containing protein n=1 Tax=Lactuca sativa TaxID=4236 RepID=A0A9R1X1E3_LACSA|nr:hypothetical protein LSAT_V11C700366580 [Lactuca sativa]